MGRLIAASFLMWLDWPGIPEYHQPKGRQSFPLYHSYLPKKNLLKKSK
jgi:hypothetical protein